MGRLFKSEEAKATKEWLQNHYEEYPRGVKKILDDPHTKSVYVQLEAQIDIDILEQVSIKHGLNTEITRDKDGTKVLNIYSVIEDGGCIVTKNLQSVFREEQEIDLGINPVEDQSPHPRLVLISDYLRRKYN